MKVEDFSSSEDQYSHAESVPCALCRQACQRMRGAPLPHGKTYPIFYKKITKTMLALTKRAPAMIIPKQFCRRYFQFSKRGQIIIEDPIKRRWHVDIYENRKGRFQLCNIGWKDFARSNNVKLGDFVLFKLVANSCLEVQVFNTCGLKKN